jgi:hypothetical protein
LEALRTITSVSKLKLIGLHGDSTAAGMAEVLRYKTDFTSLTFQHCGPFDMARIFPFLRQGPALLQELEFDNCGLGDEGTHLLVDAFVNNTNKYVNFKTLNSPRNAITPTGLFRDVCCLDASILPNLECLNLGGNDTLLNDQKSTERFAQLNDQKSTERFAQQFLLSQGTTNLKELHVWNCSLLQAEGFIIIIQSLEKNETLRILNIISTSAAHFQRIRDQLTRSLPKKEGVQELRVGNGLLDDLDDDAQQQNNLMTAFRQNVSIVKIADQSHTRFSDDPRLGPILTRNQQLVQLDSMLGTTTTTEGTNASNATTTSTAAMAPSTPRDGLWALVLAKVGQGSDGGSPVFKILRNRLATWIVAPKSSSSSTAGNGNTTNTTTRQ